MFPIPDTRLNPQWLAALRHIGIIDPLESNDTEVFTFTPDYTRGLTGTPIAELYSTLFTKNSKAKLEALKCATLCLAQVSQRTLPSSPVFALHSRSTTHTASPKRYAERSFSNHIMTQVLDALVNHGFASYHNGFKGPTHPKGLTTIWLATEAFSSWLERHKPNLTIQTFREDSELILLRDHNRRLIDYPESDHTTSMRENLKDCNAHRNSFTWSYMALDRQYWKETIARKGKSKKSYYQFEEGLERHNIEQPDLTCKRVFKENFDAGGRLFCNAQSLSKAERSTILIDGAPTVEIDLKSLHPRLLYNLEGLEAPSDCYAASTDSQRKLNKEVCMLVLNSKSMAEAVKALTYHSGIDTENAKNAVKDFVSQHNPIAHTFFKSQWKRLQNLDGQLADNIVSKCVYINIPVLPIHDSFITSTEHALQLECIIEEHYRAMTGFNPVLTWPENKEADNVYEELLAKFASEVEQAMVSAKNSASLCEK